MFAYKTTTGSAPLYLLRVCVHGMCVFTAVCVPFGWVTILGHMSRLSLTKFSTSDLCASRSLRSASEQRIIVSSQRDTKSLSQTFSLTVPSWWNDLPNSIRAAESLAIFKKQLKTHLFHLYLTL